MALNLEQGLDFTSCPHKDKLCSLEVVHIAHITNNAPALQYSL